MLMSKRWLSLDGFTVESAALIAAVREPKSIVYGPLRAISAEPSVVLLRLNGKQQMLLHDAWPSGRFEGKPQCHIIPIAKEGGEIAVSAEQAKRYCLRRRSR